MQLAESLGFLANVPDLEKTLAIYLPLTYDEWQESNT